MSLSKSGPQYTFFVAIFTFIFFFFSTVESEESDRKWEEGEYDIQYKSLAGIKPETLQCQCGMCHNHSATLPRTLLEVVIFMSQP